MATKEQVAQWMVEQIETNGFLYQEEAVDRIAKEFGAEWVYENDNGNLAINRGVLTAFRKIKPERVEWDRSDLSWS